MPADVIAEYWSKIQAKDPFQYRERQSYLRRKSLRWCRTAPNYLEPPFRQVPVEPSPQAPTQDREVAESAVEPLTPTRRSARLAKQI